jgi:hypothetical protein
LLRKVAQASVGVPITMVMDNARYALRVQE